ncbi:MULTISPECIES: hypothetical protein [Pseudomonas]|uniref:hypothetical protein n=1 Tax=Pseudomonas TaxID=286 RepID=UPI00218BF3A3|nr:hypothetical protein [Pseudomonas sp. LRP2-20]BDM22583.1 hypothetical protein KMS_R23400 [Pseudomonas sp. LRP2-20]
MDNLSKFKLLGIDAVPKKALRADQSSEVRIKYPNKETVVYKMWLSIEGKTLTAVSDNPFAVMALEFDFDVSQLDREETVYVIKRDRQHSGHVTLGAALSTIVSDWEGSLTTTYDQDKGFKINYACRAEQAYEGRRAEGPYQVLSAEIRFKL